MVVSRRSKLYLNEDVIGLSLRRLGLDEAHVQILGVGELVLVERVVLNGSSDPILKGSSQSNKLR